MDYMLGGVAFKKINWDKAVAKKKEEEKDKK